MAFCPPITPNSATGLFNTTSIQKFTAAFNSPTNRYDPKQITALNILFNALLQALPDSIRDQYPDLSARFDQGANSDEEFADILFDGGISPDNLQDIFENDLPNPIPLDDIIDFIDRIITDPFPGDEGGDLGDDDINVELPINNDDIEDDIDVGLDVNITNLDQYRDAIQFAINVQITNQGPFIDTGSDVINDAIDDIDNIPLDRFIPDTKQIDITEWQPTPRLVQYLQQADNYYKQNLAVAITENICGGFINPFAKLSSLIAEALVVGDLLSGLANKVKGLIDSIGNFSITNLLNLIVSRLQELMQNLLDLPKRLQAQLLAKVQSLQETAMRFINDVKVGAKNLFKQINKKVQQIKDFLSDLNIENIQNKILNTLELNQNQFEELLPAVLNTLALKACGLSNGISLILSRPVDEFKSFLDRMLLNYQITQIESIDHTNQAIAGGAIRIPSATRVEEQERAARTFNERTPGANAVITPGRYITIPMTDEERRWIDSITEDYSVEFKFADSVKTMGAVATDVYLNGCPRRPPDHAPHYDTKENEPNSGWKYICDFESDVFVKLRRASSRLNAGTLTINSAFRSRYYNRIVLRECRQNKDVHWDSHHMKGKAIDISTNGLSESQVAELIKYCSQEGFSRISVYNTFIHCDTVDQGTYRGNWTKNYRGSDLIRTAMTLHLRDEFRKGPR